MFEKNLEAIDNLALKRRLTKISPIESRVGISYCITPSNDYILLKDDVPSDDLQNPREAVRSMLKDNIKHEMKSNDIIITFGIGLGYLLDETFMAYPSKIFVYEPDLELLHFVLNNVDISEHLSSGRVFLTNDMDELIAKLSNTYITKDKVEIVYLKNYAVVKNKELLMLTQKVLDTCKSKMVDINTISKFSKKWLLNTINNIGTINSGNVYLLSDLENKFIGQTAIIAAAGPSLNDNISKIKANRDKFVVFSVNKAVRHLLENGIVPDFVVCLDASYMGKTLSGLTEQLTDVACIMDIRTDHYVLEDKFKQVFVNFSETDFLSKRIAKFNKFIKFYEAGGSASTLALTAASKMGFSKIILVGVDLAFKEGQIYADGESVQRISQNEMIVDSVKKHIVQVKSVTGAQVYTRDDYAAFIHHFGTLIKELNCLNVYNVSTFGAQIEGAKNANFDVLVPTQVLPKNISFELSPFKLDTKDFIQEEFCYINNVISLLSKGTFSPALVSAIVKSALVYQYMQAVILTTLQKNFEPTLAEEFIEKTKSAIKTVVECLQKNKLL
jgi:hypothetical protein